MSYMGSKGAAGVFQAIIALMPPHDTYVEAFAGSAVIARRKAPALRTILMEKDPAALAALKAMEIAAAPGVEIRAADALDHLAALDLAQLGRVVIYADPPYLHETRGPKRYPCEISTADHVRLAATLRDLAAAGAAVIVSGYPSPLYDQLFAGWETREFQAMTRGGVRTEKVWLSFRPGAVHWASFAGRDYIDRQRIKRKAATWARRFAALPPAEAMAVFAAIVAARDLAQSPASVADSATVARICVGRAAGAPPARIDGGDDAEGHLHSRQTSIGSAQGRS